MPRLVGILLASTAWSCVCLADPIDDIVAKAMER
jgi:hypothetical protein